MKPKKRTKDEHKMSETTITTVLRGKSRIVVGGVGGNLFLR